MKQVLNYDDVIMEKNDIIDHSNNIIKIFEKKNV